MKHAVSFLILVALFLQIPSIVFAQDSEQDKQATPPASVEYPLPYPGMLPDHPLFFLKVVRDKIVETLIADNTKKAEFKLLKADKDMNAALMLQAEKKQEKALDMVDQASKKIADSIMYSQKVREEGKDVSQMVAKTKTAHQKYLEIISGFENEMSNDAQQRLEKARSSLEESLRTTERELRFYETQ